MFQGTLQASSWGVSRYIGQKRQGYVASHVGLGAIPDARHSFNRAFSPKALTQEFASDAEMKWSS